MSAQEELDKLYNKAAAAQKAAGANLSFAAFLKQCGYKPMQVQNFAEWVISYYDKNQNGKIDGTEKTAYNAALSSRRYTQTYAMWQNAVETAAAYNATEVNRYLKLYESEIQSDINPDYKYNETGGGTTVLDVNAVPMAEKKNKTVLYVVIGAVALLLLMKKWKITLY